MPIIGRPWSKSKMDVAEACPLRWDLQYIAKVKGDRIEKGAGRVGSAAHEALEHLLKRPDLDVEELFKKCSEKQQLTSVEDEEFRCMRDQVVDFPKRFRAWMDRHGVAMGGVGVERRLAIREDFSRTKFFDNKGGMFRGVVDLMARIPNGNEIDIVVIDHKTGKSKDLTFHETQKRSYAILADAEYKRVRSVRFAIHFVRDGDIKWFDPVPAKTIREVYRPWLMEKILTVEAMLAERKTTEPELGWGCDWCAYQAQCPIR